MGKLTQFKLDTTLFDDIIEKLKKVVPDVKAEITPVLQKAQKKVNDDTRNALSSQYLPAHGKYSKGTTEQSIVTEDAVTWSGDVASIPIGFDFEKPGAGGYLIKGTPRMKADPELSRMYDKKRYRVDVELAIRDELAKKLVEKLSEV